MYCLKVRCKQYDTAVDTLERTLTVMMTTDGTQAAAGRCAAGLVMVQLMRDDHIAASKAFGAYGAYCDNETAPALRNLLEAFDEQDGEGAKEAINSKAIKNLDIDYARLAKHIVLPDSADLEAAAAKLGAERAEAAAKEKAAAKAAKERAEAAASSAASPQEVIEEQKKLEEDDDDEDDLC